MRDRGPARASRRRAPDREELAVMSAALAHRGPDGSGHHLDAHAGLAIRRLALVDPIGGGQPIANEDGSIHVIANGELYDHRALRRRLERRGHSFRTGSDVEVLVHLYEERGPAFVEDLRGMFAVALWDARRRRLVLARDPFGIKPLIYARPRAAAGVRVRAEGAARAAGLPARHRPGRGRGLSRTQRGPRPANDLRRGAQAAARAPPRRRPERRARRALRAASSGATGRLAPRAARGAGRGGARAARRLRARPSRRRRAGRRPAVRRDRLQPRHRARRARRCRRSASASTWRTSTSWPVRVRSPSATAPTIVSCASGRRRCMSCRAWPRPTTSRPATPPRSRTGCSPGSRRATSRRC